MNVSIHDSLRKANGHELLECSVDELSYRLSGARFNNKVVVTGSLGTDYIWTRTLKLKEETRQAPAATENPAMRFKE